MIAVHSGCDRGVEGLSLRGIARKHGYSPAAIYEYFVSLEDILMCLHYEGADGLVGALGECCKSMPEGTSSPMVLLKLGDVFRKHALKDPELYRFTYNVMKQPKDPERASEMDEGGLGAVLREVRRGIERGELIDVPPYTIALAAWTAAHRFVSLEVSDHFSWFRNTGVSDIEGEDAVAAIYHQLMLGVIRGWTTDKGRALLPS